MRWLLWTLASGALAFDAASLPGPAPGLAVGDKDTAPRHGSPHHRGNSTGPASLSGILDALMVMQSDYFQLWVGTWPSAIDWTAAVLNTYIGSSLMTFSSSLWDPHQRDKTVDQGVIDRYFAHSSAFYFGENAFSLRNQAFDDMLWVVLDWLEHVNFVKTHTATYRLRKDGAPWHGEQFTAAFAHRARIFYDLAAKGWDTKLCGGGMNWNPRLTPYKNAITNQLFISASMAMYFHFPGDDNTSPYDIGATGGAQEPFVTSENLYDPTYLDAAITAYDWLKTSSMTNSQGLYVDGFHISGWSRRNSTGTGKCDARNEMVYTYNQGVILSGLRALWEATGDATYLEDAHQLVEDTISATGYAPSGRHAPQWSGLGRNGVLEDHCDHTGDCSQDGHTFKGIYFHHLLHLCEPLPRHPRTPGRTSAAPPHLARHHLDSCRRYQRWVEHNAAAAIGTTDAAGRFGMWWGAHGNVSRAPELIVGAVDYRNDARELFRHRWADAATDDAETVVPVPRVDRAGEQGGAANAVRKDVNDRGRGRTVETQGSGLSVLRAAYEMRKLLRHGDDDDDAG